MLVITTSFALTMFVITHHYMLFAERRKPVVLVPDSLGLTLCPMVGRTTIRSSTQEFDAQLTTIKLTSVKNVKNKNHCRHISLSLKQQQTRQEQQQRRRQQQQQGRCTSRSNGVC